MSELEAVPVSNATHGPDLVVESQRLQVSIEPDKVSLVLVEGNVVVTFDAVNATVFAREIALAAHDAYRLKLEQLAAGNTEPDPGE